MAWLGQVRIGRRGPVGKARAGLAGVAWLGGSRCRTVRQARSGLTRQGPIWQAWPVLVAQVTEGVAGVAVVKMQQNGGLRAPLFPTL